MIQRNRYQCGITPSLADIPHTPDYFKRQHSTNGIRDQPHDQLYRGSRDRSSGNEGQNAEVGDESKRAPLKPQSPPTADGRRQQPPVDLRTRGAAGMTLPLSPVILTLKCQSPAKQRISLSVSPSKVPGSRSRGLLPDSNFRGPLGDHTACNQLNNPHVQHGIHERHTRSEQR
jgi:hypothetical protein